MYSSAADKKKPIEDALEGLKKAHESKDLAAIDSAMETINTAWTAASEEMTPNSRQLLEILRMSSACWKSYGKLEWTIFIFRDWPMFQSRNLITAFPKRTKRERERESENERERVNEG